MPTVTPPKFKILVANLAASGDPSRGVEGNPVKTRTGFVLQTVVCANGTTRIGGPVQTPPVPSSSNYTVAIQVLAPDYWDPTVAAPPPFLTTEEVQIGAQYFTASEDFGVGLGSGTGPTSAIATSLALAVNTVEGVRAVATGDTVYITSRRSDGLLPVKASNDMGVVLGAYTFSVIGPGGVVLTTAPQDRVTYYVVKPFKTQAPPTILP